MGAQLTDAVLTINNDVIGYVPNSLDFDEGLGEQNALPVSEGGGRTSQVYSNNLETNVGEVTVSLRVTVENVERALAWKQNANRNAIEIAGQDPDGKNVIRSFSKCLLSNNYKVPFQAEGVIELVFQTNAPI